MVALLIKNERLVFIVTFSERLEELSAQPFSQWNF
jgi:hypothetical protein